MGTEVSSSAEEFMRLRSTTLGEAGVGQRGLPAPTHHALHTCWPAQFLN